MELIAAADTVDFLSKSAPAPWVKRMLLWMIFDGELAAFFREGRSVASTYVFAAFGDAGDQDRETFAREKYGDGIAEKLMRAGHHDLIDDLVFEWGQDDEPYHVAPGYFARASRIDWGIGSVVAEIDAFEKIDRDLFWDEEDLLNSVFDHARYTIELKGLSFEREKIEMLQPGVQISHQPAALVMRRPLGRPRKWDWDGATMHLLTIAQTPDGLPLGPGGQANIERELAEWFVKTTGDGPSPSQIRQHASKVMRTLKTPETP